MVSEEVGQEQAQVFQLRYTDAIYCIPVLGKAAIQLVQ